MVTLFHGVLHMALNGYLVSWSTAHGSVNGYLVSLSTAHGSVNGYLVLMENSTWLCELLPCFMEYCTCSVNGYLVSWSTAHGLNGYLVSWSTAHGLVVYTSQCRVIVPGPAGDSDKDHFSGMFSCVIRTL